MTCVIVLGPPRCGTSAVAGLLHLLGVPMGDELMEPMEGVNPKGFFEDMDFVRLHIRLMGAHEDPRVDFDRGDLPDQADLRAYEALIARRDRQALWGVKDPKLCFLLPYFLRRLPCTAIAVVVHRDLRPAADSMQPLYGGMPLDRAILLQGRYRYALEKNVVEWQDRLYLVRHLYYNQLIEDPHREAARLAHACGVEVGPHYDAIGAFIDAELKHH